MKDLVNVIINVDNYKEYLPISLISVRGQVEGMNPIVHKAEDFLGCKNYGKNRFYHTLV